MTGARAERNEYILLHEFHRLKYVCPDKGEGKPSSRSAKKPTFDAEGNVMVEPKKNKYQGGLVFEPKRGLWDTYVMVMDFNSLYPSIIQEYNIDFTTVDRDPNAVSCEIRLDQKMVYSLGGRQTGRGRNSRCAFSRCTTGRFASVDRYSSRSA